MCFIVHGSSTVIDSLSYVLMVTMTKYARYGDSDSDGEDGSGDDDCVRSGSIDGDVEDGDCDFDGDGTC